MDELDQAFLLGHSVYLRQPKEDDVRNGAWARWYNDQDTTRYNSHGIFPISVDQEWEYVCDVLEDRSKLMLAIVESASHRLVGNICIQNIDFVNRSCRLAIMMGERSTMTAGIEAFGLMTEHAFRRLNLNRVADATHSNLKIFLRAISLFGYLPEGVGRQHYQRDGVAADCIYFGCLKDDFFEEVSKRKGHCLFADLESLQSAVLERSKLNLAVPAPLPEDV